MRRTAAKLSSLVRFGQRRVDTCYSAMKSHTPECARIEKFAATLLPVKSYLACVQDFKTKDYRLEFHGESITITRQQFDDGTWEEIVKQAFQ